ncbi:MAG TPA: hypothetical protein VH280_03800 [Verrucomicrobiae bacterium]|nr:hypothetical protein [Verrucomicrobiae bacterium]
MGFLSNGSNFGRPASKPSTNIVLNSSEERLRDWVCRIQEVCAREANSVLDLARLMAQARNTFAHGDWTAIWRTGELPFALRKGQMLVAIGDGVEGLNAHNCARLPSAIHTLYQIAFLGPKLLEQLISQGRIRPGLTLAEAKALRAEYLPEPGAHKFAAKYPHSPGTAYWVCSEQSGRLVRARTENGRRQTGSFG